jgi:hypothetical protein
MLSSQIVEIVGLLVHLLHKSIVIYKYILCGQKTANSSYSTTKADISTQWKVYLKPGEFMNEKTEETQSGLDSNQNV